MSRGQQPQKPKSLAQLFEAPDEYHGFFGWLCGYSADAAFLNDALERFTRQTSAQRACIGATCIAGLLDPTNPWISPVDVPGFAHLRILHVDRKPFKLLHAKVALLGFRHNDDPEQWMVRLIVSTGNWTRGTMEETLDLAWTTETSSQDRREKSVEVKQVLTDIDAAWRMFGNLRSHFDDAILGAVPSHRTETQTSNAFERFTGIASRIRSASGVEPRFFHNWHKSLLQQLPAKLKAMNTHTRRNYLAMGSGFFEGSSGSNEIPSVIKGIVDTLQKASLLSVDPYVQVFVNPDGCQSVADGLSAFPEHWTVRRAFKHPGIFGEGNVRTLHAKFLLSGNQRESNDYLTSPWVYLGSGNLTQPGFSRKMSPDRGNLEAGVVFGTSELYWNAVRDVPPERVIPNILPMRWNDEEDIVKVPSDAKAGPSFMEGEIVCVAPPISFLLWSGTNESGTLSMATDESATDEKTDFDVLDSTGNTCLRKPHGGFIWSGPCPRQVTVRWLVENSTTKSTLVPVIDEFGRVSASPLQTMELDDAWRQLETFPMAPDDADDEFGGDSVPLDAETDNGSSSAKIVAGRYPVRTMMELIEKIADRQTEIRQSDWTAWCHRLEQTLIQSAGSDVLTQFKLLKMNPLSPLQHAPFRPEFAETAVTAEGKIYEEALSRVEKIWEVAELPAIGEINHGE